MKRLVLLPVLLLIMLAFSCSTCFSETVTESDPQDGVLNEGGPPKIQLDEKVYDFGSVYQQKSLKHTFIFRNIGTSMMRIEKVKAG